MSDEVFLDSNVLFQWGATIFSAGAELGCAIVCSEDMNDGQDYGGIRVVNPFKI